MRGRMSGPWSGGFAGLVRPMLATPARELPAHCESWAAEFKWDGLRAVAYVSGGELRLRSRGDRDITGTYPELAGIAGVAGGHQLILDGEIVASGDDGRPSFAALQRRMHVERPPAALAAAVPVTYLVFDLVHIDGQVLLRDPYARRRARLDDLALAGQGMGVPPSFPGGAPAVLAASLAHGLEGVLLKRLDSIYLPGRRSPLWLKIKHARVQDVVIGGWTPGHGHRAGLLGSLLLGVQEPAGLQYCGKVGTGFTQADLHDLTRGLPALEQPASPFASPIPPELSRHAHWVRPVLAGQVSYTEWTPAGRLRHPAWQGLRADTDPDRVFRVLPASRGAPGSDIWVTAPGPSRRFPIMPEVGPALSARQGWAVTNVLGGGLSYCTTRQLAAHYH
jgi:bifunctional non-homologous end joining protein LigD